MCVLPVRVDGLVGFVSSSLEQERGHVRRADGSVYDQDEDEPVPDGFERRVVENRPAVVARHV